MIVDLLPTCIFGIVLGFAWIVFMVPLNIKKKNHQYSCKARKTITQKILNANGSSTFIAKNLLPPFPNGWYAILESADVRAGNALSVTCFGKKFTVYRSSKGVKVHIVDAFCPHLGANLGDGEVEDNCIKCPFHSWKFNGVDGKCVEIPYKEKGIIPQNAKIQTYHSYEVNGIIFIWLHAENKFPWNLPDFKDLEERSFCYQGRNEYFINSHIQDIPENGADISHLKVLHEDFVGFGSLVKRFVLTHSNIAKHEWTAEWKPSQISYVANLNIVHCISVLKRFKLFTLAVTTSQIGPGIVKLEMRSSFGTFVCIQTVTPIEANLQRVIHRFYGPRIISWLVKLTLLGECLQFERDVKIWNNKTFIKHPVLLKEDQKIKLYRTWYNQFYSKVTAF